MDVLQNYLDDRQSTKGTPEELIRELMGEINTRFYEGTCAQTWMQDKKALMLALTWPAGWLQTRGVSLSLARYREIWREILSGIGKHGAVAKIEYFPSYLLHCVRRWFVHHGEELYVRQKSIRDSIDLALLKGSPAARSAGPDPIEALAAAHRVLANQKRTSKAKTSPADQLPLL